MIKSFFRFLNKCFVNTVVALLRSKRFCISDHKNSKELTFLSQDVKNTLLEKSILAQLPIIIDEYLNSPYQFTKSNNSSWDSHNCAFIGEHYRLLPAIVRALKASVVCEIGTYQGASARAILENTQVKIISYDILAWNEFDLTYLDSRFFNQDRIVQYLKDLSSESVFLENLNILKSADVFFVDGPKDGKFEKEFLNLIAKYETYFIGKYFIFDDTKLSTMVEVWKEIEYPKLDLTFLGHWSGTGIFVIEPRHI